MKVTLTGASGRLGSQTCRHLVEAGFTVRATDRTFRNDLPAPVEVADLLSREACYRLLEGSEAVVHLANHPRIPLAGDSQRIFNENVAMNMNVFQAAQEVGIRRIVFSSSIQAFAYVNRSLDKLPGPVFPYLPLDGRAPANPHNPYGLSKAVSEVMLDYFAREAGMSCVAIRFPTILPPTPEVPHWVRARGLSFTEALTYLDVRDAAALIGACLKADLPGFRVYFPAARDAHHPKPTPEIIREFYPNVPLTKPVDEIDFLVDIAAIERDTGWSPKINSLS
jgi:nucleoside-diphosphate-sugar epimerase